MPFTADTTDLPLNASAAGQKYYPVNEGMAMIIILLFTTSVISCLDIGSIESSGCKVMRIMLTLVNKHDAIF
jgi:hypothetical protein